jgi:DNA-binding winged helix-turn-helix (wHTH) protein/TolB-like protein
VLYSFGRFELDAAQRVLSRDAVALRLTPRAVDVLLVLVERHGEVVEKCRLFERVWSGVRVEECNLAQHVAALRRTLGDDAQNPTYIQTVPRRGYRFVAPVTRAERRTVPTASPPVREPEGSPGEDPPPSAPARAGGRRHSSRRALAAVGAAAVVAGVAFLLPDPPARRIRTLGILPVANLAGGAREAALAERLEAGLPGELEGVKDLRVERRPSARPPLGPPDPGARHGHGVDALLEVAVLGAGDRARIAVELIEATTDTLLWADVLEAAEPGALLDLKSRVADVIVSRLQLAWAEPIHPAWGPAAAWREYTIGRQYLSTGTPQVVHECLEHFTHAVQLEPGFARAHAGLASAYLLAAEQRVLEPSEALALAEAAVRRALALEPSLAEAHVATGALAEARSDLAAAEEAYLRALSLAPDLTDAHERYGRLLASGTRRAEALAHATATPARDGAPDHSAFDARSGETPGGAAAREPEHAGQRAIRRAGPRVERTTR